jgi:hypothetical protein
MDRQQNREIVVPSPSGEDAVVPIGPRTSGRRLSRAIARLAIPGIAICLVLPSGLMQMLGFGEQASCCCLVDLEPGPSGEPSGARPQPFPLADLSPDGHELKSAFNADRDVVKVLLIVSPTCPMCRSGAQLVEDKALDQIGGDKLRIYVVWTKKLLMDSRAAAAQAASLVPDRRARHFWDATGYLGKQYGKTLDLPGGRRFAWDVYFIFDRKTAWTDSPPAPAFWMHQLGGHKPELRLDGARFREAIVQRLQ